MNHKLLSMRCFLFFLTFLIFSNFEVSSQNKAYKHIDFGISEKKYKDLVLSRKRKKNNDTRSLKVVFGDKRFYPSKSAYFINDKLTIVYLYSSGYDKKRKNFDKSLEDIKRVFTEKGFTIYQEQHYYPSTTLVDSDYSLIRLYKENDKAVEVYLHYKKDEYNTSLKEWEYYGYYLEVKISKYDYFYNKELRRKERKNNNIDNASDSF